MLDTAFEALKKFDWGTDLSVLAPIEDAAAAAHGKPESDQELENRLIAALKGELTRDAQDYVCRKLAMVGTAAAVPTLAGLLINKGNSHMSRFALERIPDPKAAEALRDAIPKVSGDLKIGVISSLGGRRDSAAVEPLGKLLNDSDPNVVRAAIRALGAIGNAQSAKTLQAAVHSSINPLAVIDALLSCAEALLTTNNLANASAIYKTLAGNGHPRLVRLAATRGLLACTGKHA